ncbi:MAG: tetratricopeptide repeat protein [Acidobacteriia bacterium]|jgi:tetratricopeptide (TPR) repeat protein|nr:tetratricopeptide repeat protein [Terriglobia bacterium]
MLSPLCKVAFLGSFSLCLAVTTSAQVFGGGGATRTVSGQVVLTGGAATNVVVTLESTNRSFHRVVMTDAGGNFVFTGVPVGQHYISIEAHGYMPVRELLDVPPGTGALAVQYLLRPLAGERNVSTDPSVSVAALRIPPKARDEFRKGVQQLRAGDRTLARKHLENALKIYPQFPQALLALATLELQEEKPNLALEHLQQAVRIDNNYGDGYLLLSRVLNHLGRYSEAIEAAEKTNALLPNAWQAQFERGIAALALGNLAMATAALEQIERGASPDTPEAQLLRAGIYLKTERVLEAKAELQKFLLSHPNHNLASLARKTLEQIEANLPR